MLYLCIFNPETREIIGAEVYTDVAETNERANMYTIEAFARGYPWQMHRGEKPFEFQEVVNEEPKV